MLNPVCTHVYIHITHSTYSVKEWYCSVVQGMMMSGIFYNCHKPLKYRNRLTNELPIRWLLFHSPHRKGQDEHIHTDEHRGHHAVYRC